MSRIMFMAASVVTTVCLLASDTRAAKLIVFVKDAASSQPVSNAAVGAVNHPQSDATPEYSNSASTNSSGVGGFDDVEPNGVYNIKVTKAGYEPFGWKTVVIPNNRGAKATVALKRSRTSTRPKGAKLRVVVKDKKSSEAITGASVAVVDHPQSEATADTSQVKPTSPEGTTTFNGLQHNGVYDVKVSKNGYESSGWATVVIPNNVDASKTVLLERR